MNKILITTSSFGKEDNSGINSLKDAGYEIILNPFKRKLTEDEVLELICKTRPVAMIAGVEPLTARVIREMKGVKVISRCGIGLDNVDLEAAIIEDIVVLNTPDGPTQAVAELTIGLILSCLRHIAEGDKAMRSGDWKRPMGSLLGEKTLGLIGCGRIGSAVARLAQSFGSTLLGHDPHIDKHPMIHIVALDDLLSEADIVSIHIPYGESSYHFVNDEMITKMKKGSVLVNTSRGGIVDEDALYRALANNHLSSAALDVYENEPYKGPLTKIDNVVLSPHVGSYASETRIKMERLSVTNLLKALNNLEGQ